MLGRIELRTGTKALLLKVWPHTSRGSTTWDLIRNADSQACPDALNQNLHLSRFPGEWSATAGWGGAALRGLGKGYHQDSHGAGPALPGLPKASPLVQLHQTEAELPSCCRSYEMLFRKDLANNCHER